MSGPTCPRCEGRGRTFAVGNRIARDCPSCGGKGFISEAEAVWTNSERKWLAVLDRCSQLMAENEKLKAKLAERGGA